MKAIAITTAALLLTGCAAPQMISSSPRTVTFSGATIWSLQDGTLQAEADAECQKHGRWAVHRQDNRADGYVVFECVGS